MPSLAVQESLSPNVSWEADEKPLNLDASCHIEQQTDGGGHDDAQSEDQTSVCDETIGSEDCKNYQEVFRFSEDHKEHFGDFEDSKQASGLSQQAASKSATFKCVVNGGHTEAMTDETTIKKRRTDLKCIDEEGKCWKEKDRGLDASKDRERAKDKGSQVLEHEALDRGWAWLVLLGAFVIEAVMGLLVPCYGILFSDLLTSFNASSTVASAIFNVGVFVAYCANMVAGPLMEQFGWRCVAVGGGLLAFVGMAATAFTPSAYFLLFSYSILSALGQGHCSFVSYAVMPHYFKRRIGMANALMSSGVCVGGIVGPPAIIFLQEQYGFRGATLIVAAFALNFCLGGALFRPLQRPSNVSKTTESTDKGAKDKEAKDKESKYMPIKNRDLKNSEDQEVTKSMNKTAATGEDKAGLCCVARQMAASMVTNMKLLKTSHVAFMSSAGALMMVGEVNLSALVPFVIQEYGHTQEAAGWCLSVANFCNLAARFLMASCTDFSWFHIRGFFIVSVAMVSCFTVVVALVQDLTWVTVALGLWGFGVGNCYALLPLLLLRHLGVGRYMGALALHGLLTGPGTVITGFVIGALRDFSGNYTISLCFIGATVSISVILLLLMPTAVAYDKRKEDKHRKKDVEVW
ncbi:monocarboxylate transporter 12-like [Eriocheir sinensis]|uniref:monocarboxylate transporter 12-like n=1 Tax=Eriocheir sinensis TaxID=95602 RepID=UPI0021C72582|nr:monocarboxylate transporter 12-like [Eriocheir sinensis]